VLGLIALLSLIGLLAVWGLYPLIIVAIGALTARRRAVTVPPGATNPLVSIIITTRHDLETTRRRIADCLLTSHDLSKLEIVVAVDPRVTSDLVRDLASTMDELCVVHGDAPGGKAATLNAGVRASRGDVLVFTDVHQRFYPDAIPELVRALRAPGVGAVSGSLEFPERRARRTLPELYWSFERWLRRHESVVHSCVGVTGAIWAMRRAHWTPLPDQLINDDVYAPMRIVLGGHRVAFAQHARAIETRRHAPREEYARKVRTLTGVIQVCSWLPRVLNPLRNPIWVQFVFHKLLRLLTPYWVAAIALWVVVTAARWLEGKLLAAITLGVIAGVATYYTRSSFAKRAWETVVSGALLQAAAVVGTVNGVRRRWDVWGTGTPASTASSATTVTDDARGGV
jgi:poly-beta-1,6-N-acetyl-D-glucosamine synthase